MFTKFDMRYLEEDGKFYGFIPSVGLSIVGNSFEDLKSKASKAVEHMRDLGWLDDNIVEKTVGGAWRLKGKPNE
jgi:hypothetical protein